jgi:hypothetical protein
MDMKGFPERVRRIPLSGYSEGAEGDRAVDFINGYYYEYVNGRWVKSVILNMLLAQQDFVYVSDGDTNGLNYFLGTNFGTVTWANPFPTLVGNNMTNAYSGIVMSVSGYLAGQTDPPGITDRAGSHVHVQGSPRFVTWDFGSGSFVLTKWNLQNRDNFADGSSQVTVEGSNDNASWNSLSVVTGRTTATGAWSGGVSTNTQQWRFIRVRSVADGGTYFTIGEIELYGSLFYVR